MTSVVLRRVRNRPYYYYYYYYYQLRSRPVVGTVECRHISIHQVSLRLQKVTFSLITNSKGGGLVGEGMRVTPSGSVEANRGSEPTSVQQGRR